MITFVFLLATVFSEDKLYLESLYSRQDPRSLTKQLNFYAQYPHTLEGQKAKKRIQELLGLEDVSPTSPLNLEVSYFEELLRAVFKTTKDPILLDATSINTINKLSSNNKNRSLIGSKFLTEKELIDADISDIDVGRGMLILAFGDSDDLYKKIQSYEAVLDFMAACIRARLKLTSTHEDIIHAMNHFIFYELGYRFPAFSEHEEKIDKYTILPSVLDNRQGVCLGVSLLYYSLAQRLGLNLDIYTPPGHIFLSLHPELNIETTARGVHMPLERYLSLHVKELKKRNQKELLGMALFNQASVFLRKQNFQDAISLYERALKFIPDDPLILELLGSCYVMNRDLKKANHTFSVLKKLKKSELSSDFVLEDYLKGLITPEGLKAVFQEVDSDMQSLFEKAKKLEEVHKKSPKFRSALYQLGITYLQMHQYEKAFIAFEKLYPEASKDPALVYYLTQLALIRYDRPKTLHYRAKLLEITKEINYTPDAVMHLFEEIQDTWPDKN